MAAQKNKPDVVGLLLERGADPSALDKVREGGCFVVASLSSFLPSPDVSSVCMTLVVSSTLVCLLFPLVRVSWYLI